MKKIDMTEGSIVKKVLLFALPIVLGNILQYLYTTVDTLVIGNYCDHTALAGVGTSSQPIEVLLCIFLGIGTGVSILMSQFAGADNRKGIEDASKTAVSIVYFCGIPISIIGYFAAPLLLRIMQVPEDVWGHALIYTRIVLISATGNIGYNMNAGILRGIGDSTASLYFLIVSCLANIGLDLLLVAVFHMGVAGVAIATGVAMFVSWISSIIYIKVRYPNIGFTVLPKGMNAKVLRQILAIGLPIGLNNSLFSFGHMAMQTLVNEQGSVFMAGWSVSGRVNGLANMAISGISAAATTFSGQNFGAKRIDRLKQGQYLIPFLSGGITLTLGLLFILVRMPVLRMFTKDVQVLEVAGRQVIVMMSCQWMYAVFSSISNIVNGTGRVKYTTVVNLLMLWAVRIPAAWLIATLFDGGFIMLAYPASFGFGMFAMLGYYKLCAFWKKLMQTARLTQSTEEIQNAIEIQNVKDVQNAIEIQNVKEIQNAIEEQIAKEVQNIVEVQNAKEVKIAKGA